MNFVVVDRGFQWLGAEPGSIVTHKHAAKVFKSRERARLWIKASFPAIRYTRRHHTWEIFRYDATLGVTIHHCFTIVAIGGWRYADDTYHEATVL